MQSFGARLAAGMREHGPLCVGIDPHAALLRDWGLDDTAAGAREFGLRVVAAAEGRAAVVKPQVSFYERFGSAGFAALEEVLGAARDAGLLVIADAKRGDIGSTMSGYIAAWLVPGSPLEADAVTVSPYLGPDSLRDAFGTAAQHGKGVFVLAATSNPDALVLQTAVTAESGEPVARRVAREVAGEPEGLGSIGLVVGATVDRPRFGLTDDVLHGVPLLAPGFGAQGAAPADLPSVFGTVRHNVVASESRSILSRGPEHISAAISARNAEYREALHA